MLQIILITLIIHNRIIINQILIMEAFLSAKKAFRINFRNNFRNFKVFLHNLKAK
jgi:hypothetical protein